LKTVKLLKTVLLLFSLREYTVTQAQFNVRNLVSRTNEKMHLSF